VVIDRAGRPVLLSFVDRDADDAFGGWITDPVPLALTGRGTLQPAQQ
jgi:hypothetical protein